MPKEYKECEECRSRVSLRAHRCDACGGKLKHYRRGMTVSQRLTGFVVGISVAAVVAVVGELLRRFM